MGRAVEVVSYDPNWACQYRLEAEVLSAVLGDQALAVHHIGSTAVPGMPAKPIIDLMVEVRAIERIDDLNEGLLGLGYLPKGEFGIPGRRFFIKPGEDVRTHHVHMFAAGNSEIVRHLRFRDYLIAHPQEAKRYGCLKRMLAQRFHTDIGAYMDGKDSTVGELDRKAMAWVDSRNA